MPDDDVLRVLLGAIRFAAEKHRDQRRKGEEASPYINHPIAVAEILTQHGVQDTVTLLAAILHDTIEDTEATPEELEERFGSDVRRVVEEVTDDKSAAREARKEQQVERAHRLSPRAKLVKIADKLANVRDVVDAPPAGWPVERRVAYLEWTRAVVEGCRGTNTSLESAYFHTLEQGLIRLQKQQESL
jgi:(p)ppGpp synthase/HD superfamily hydrolase